jgi:MYXO-CTERM domain-containing protein
MGCCKGGGPPGSWTLTDAAVQPLPRLTLVPDPPPSSPAPKSTPWWVWALVGLLAFTLIGKRS